MRRRSAEPAISLDKAIDFDPTEMRLLRIFCKFVNFQNNFFCEKRTNQIEESFLLFCRVLGGF